MDSDFVGACETLKGKRVLSVVQSIDGLALDLTFEDGTLLTLFESHEIARITITGVPMSIWQTKVGGPKI